MAAGWPVLRACAAIVALVGAAVASAPSIVSAMGAALSAGNDTAYKGSYEAYDPESQAEVIGGVQIEGSEEERLQ